MKRILYVLHSGKAGGVYLNVLDIIKNLDAEKFETYLLFSETHELLLYKYNNQLELIRSYSKSQWDITEFNNSWLSYVYYDILIKEKIDIVHINHFINHSFDMPSIAKSLGIKVVITFHDYYLLCPFYTLIDENNEYCGGNCKNNNINCYKPSIIHNINSKQFINTWRQKVNKMFSDVDYFIAPSNFTKNIFLSFYKDRNIINEDNLIVIEHGGDYPDIKSLHEVPSKNKPIKILFPANYLNLLKGSNLIKEIKKCDVDNKLDFYFMGHVEEDLEKYGKSYGVYERNDFQKIVGEIKPSFIGIFSICPETFCFTLSESWSCGIPILGTNIGVINERITNNDGGWIIDYKNPEKSYNMILKIASDKKEYKNKLRNVKKINLKNTKEMTYRYYQLYNML